MAKPKRAAIYLRVSTDEQTTQNQQRELAAVRTIMAGWWWRSMKMPASVVPKVGTSGPGWMPC